MVTAQTIGGWEVARPYPKRALSDQMASEERARQSVARDVHDVVSHHLISAHLLIAKVKSSPMDRELQRTVGEVAQEIQFALDDLRSLCFLLNSPIDANARLDTEVHKLLSGFAERSNLSVCSRVARVGKVGDPVHQTIVRVLQEALSNIFRHSKATTVGCALRRKGQAINLVVHDNGDASKDEIRAGVGISSMMARVERIGGHFRIRFGSHGTTVAARIPLAQIATAR